MPISEAEFARRLRRLRDDYVERLPGRLVEIASSCACVFEPGRPLSGAEPALRAAHNLAGTGESFGFRSLGTAARELETGLRAVLDGGGAPPPAARREVHAKLAALFDAAGDAGVRELPELPAAP